MYFVVPYIIYWLSAYFLYKPIESKRNVVAKSTVIKRVLLMQSMSVATQTLIHWNCTDDYFRWYSIPLGIFLIDTSQYWMHRLFHIKLLYRYFHYVHHQLKVIYSYGAIYGNLFDAGTNSLVIELLFLLFKYSKFEMMIIQSLAMFATVYIHATGYNKFHEIHHSSSKHGNFQQPFFTFWDDILGTRIIE